MGYFSKQSTYNTEMEIETEEILTNQYIIQNNIDVILNKITETACIYSPDEGEYYALMKQFKHQLNDEIAKISLQDVNIEQFDK